MLGRNWDGFASCIYVYHIMSTISFGLLSFLSCGIGHTEKRTVAQSSCSGPPECWSPSIKISKMA